MRHIPQHRPARAVVCRVVASWCREVVSGGIEGLPVYGEGASRHCIPVHGLGQRVGRQSQRLA
jgi:hypothetical protein